MIKKSMLAVMVSIAMLCAVIAPLGVAFADEGFEISSSVDVSTTVPDVKSGVGGDDGQNTETIVIEPILNGAPQQTHAETPDAGGGGQQESGSQQESGGDQQIYIVPIENNGSNYQQQQELIIPPVDTGVPTPQREVPQSREETGTVFMVTFVFMDEYGAQQTTQEGVLAGESAPVPQVPDIYTVPGTTDQYKFEGWPGNYINVQQDETVQAQYRKITTYMPNMDSVYLLNYTGKPGQTVRLHLPVWIENTKDPTDIIFSNTLLDGTRVQRYDEKVLVDMYNQALFTRFNIQQMRFDIDTAELSALPFTSTSITDANTRRGAPYVVQKVVDEAAYYAQHGFMTGSVNRGFAFFDLKVRSDVENGSYIIPLILRWQDDEGIHEERIEANILISGASSGSVGGGSVGGGMAGADKPQPKARFYIENVRTEPPEPKAGDSFDIIMTVVNSSKTQYLQNMMLTFSNTEDSIIPAGENTNVVYIPRVPKDSKHELKLSVDSMPDISNKMVKLDISASYEDQKLGEETAQQTITIPVKPNQRLTVDEPSFPTGIIYTDQEYEFEIQVSNTGKVKLYNLSAEVKSTNENLLPGTPYRGGDLAPAEAKKITLKPVPTLEGPYECTIEITYENDAGDPETFEKKFSFEATQEEEPDYGFDSNVGFEMPTEPEPEAPMAMQIMSQLPWWIYAGLGALLLLIIVSMTVSARKRRKRAMEDDEMD